MSDLVKSEQKMARFEKNTNAMRGLSNAERVIEAWRDGGGLRGTLLHTLQTAAACCTAAYSVIGPHAAH